MGFDVVRSNSVDQDLEAIFDFLVQAAEHFGDSAQDAFSRAEARLLEIEESLDHLGSVPHQGTLWPELGEGIRCVTKGRAIVYFDTRDDARTLRVLAVFFGGQDHDTRILARLLR